MRTQSLNFNNIVKSIYGLPLEDRLEIKFLLEHNIAEARREEIASNYKKSQTEHKASKMKFSSNVEELKKML
ncbi:MAG: hypothetical protein SFY32_17550 [Bacteroidota bacterium]|nr:hypothetical protein [Bacteroidota bacterium]